MEDIEVESSKREESISGNRIIDVNINIGIFGEMFMPYTFFFINNQKFKQSPRKSLIC